MEYMLLLDGSVLVHEPLFNVHEIGDALALHMGAAYYWHNHQFGWSCVKASASYTSEDIEHNIGEDALPPIIKLAVMLK